MTGSGVTETDPAHRERGLPRRHGAAGGRAARSGTSAHRPQFAVTQAVVLATAPAGEGGAAAALPWEDRTVLDRLLGQIASLGIREIDVITRPAWAEDLRRSLDGVAVELHPSEDTAGDLRIVAALTRRGDGGVVVACGDIVTHREALAGLAADPRIATGILTTTRRAVGRPFAFRTRSVRGRVVSAASPYHAVHAPNAKFLGVLKVAPAQRGELAEVAERLATLTAPPLPDRWEEELEVKAGTWRVALALAALRASREEAADDEEESAAEIESVELDPESVVLTPEEEAEVGRWLAAAPHDAASLLVVGLVRSGVHVGVSHLRRLFWARPLSSAAVERAAVEIEDYDEDEVLLDSAVKANDGFFTTFFVSPYSRYIARWAARRGLTPNQVTVVSLLIGCLAAAAFATGERAGLVAGAILLQLSFTTDCVDGQLARYTRTFSSLGAWLDSIFDRTKEYLIFAGLAIGASRTGSSVWLLAGAALALQTARHAIDFSYPAAQHQALGLARQPPLERPSDTDGAGGAGVAAVELEAPDAAEPEVPLPRRAVRGVLRVWRLLDRRRGVRWVKKVVAFPIGERFAVISLTAALTTPRTTFIVLLAWGGAAGCYVAAGRLLRSALR